MLMTKLVNLPMHVILTGRLKDEYRGRGGDVIKVGVKMEAEKSTPYAPDICFRLEMEDGKGLAAFLKRTGPDILIEAPESITRAMKPFAL